MGSAQLFAAEGGEIFFLNSNDSILGPKKRSIYCNKKAKTGGY
jgi:hypothetical protein